MVKIAIKFSPCVIFSFWVILGDIDPNKICKNLKLGVRYFFLNLSIYYVEKIKNS